MSRSGARAGLSMIAEALGGAGSSTLTLAIPTSPAFRAIEIEVIGRGSGAAANCQMQFNGDATAANYDYQVAYGSAATVTAAENIGALAYIFAGHVPASAAPANLFSSSRIVLPNYNVAQQKIATVDAAGITNLTTGTIFRLSASGVWESTTAITSVALILSAGNWDVGSRATAYGRI
jgi:hypothetical protein